MKHIPFKAVQGIGADNQSWDIDDSRGHEVARELSREHAVLFAAAPELLEACKAALKALDEYQPNCFENHQLRTAIAKTEGKGE